MEVSSGWVPDAGWFASMEDFSLIFETWAGRPNYLLKREHTLIGRGARKQLSRSRSCGLQGAASTSTWLAVEPYTATRRIFPVRSNDTVSTDVGYSKRASSA